MFLKHLKVQYKLFILILVAVLFLCGVGLTGFIYMEKMQKATEQIYTQRLLPIKWINEMRAHSRAIEANTYRIITVDDENASEILQLDITERLKGYDQLNEQLIAVGNHTDEETKMFDQLRELNRTYRASSEQAISLALEGKNDEAMQTFISRAANPLDQINNLLQKIANGHAERADALNIQLTREAQQATTIMIVVIVVAAVLSVAVSLIISRYIVAPIRTLQELMARAADGDLCVETNSSSNDELGKLSRSFDRMLSQMRQVIHQMVSTSEQVAASAQELTASAEQTGKASELISMSSEELATGAVTQSQKVEEGLETANHIAGDAIEVARSTEQVANNALQTATVARDGSKAIQDAQVRMDGIQGAVTDLAVVMHKLGQQSDEISGIVGMMTEIANQTNLLALNASIEAARAGEHGRGFAVVADEVRSLADQSIKAAQQVRELVVSIQAQMEQAITNTKQTEAQVNEGLAIVDTAGQSFEEIEQSVSSLADELLTVSSSVNGMAQGTEKIVQSIQQILKIAEEASAGAQHVRSATEEQLATMEEITASSQHLAGMSQEMQTLVGRFNV